MSHLAEERRGRTRKPKIAQEMLGLADSVAEPTHEGDYRDALEPTLARTEMTEHGESGGKQRDFPAGEKHGSDEGSGRFRKAYKNASPPVRVDREVKDNV